MKGKRLSDKQLQSICEQELRAASGSSELARKRADAMDRYLGEPYGDEKDGRSQVRTREVLDTIEWIMPSLMRVFCDAENLVLFEPVSQEDEEQAEQETDACHHVWWQHNPGMLNLYTFCKDALLSTTGTLKIEWDDKPHEEREEYHGLNDFELASLFEDEMMVREVESAEPKEDGWHVVFLASRAEGRVKVTPIPPEEMGVSRDARSPNIKEAPFSWTRTKQSKSDLIEAGYDREKVEKIPLGDDFEGEEQLARRHLEDEQHSTGYESTKSTARVWVTECYIRTDRDGDGINELVKVVLAHGNATEASGSILLDVEEIDRVPLVAASPIILTHKFYGLSLADLVMDLQQIKTTLLRSQLDNLYLINNQQIGINEKVNPDDAQTRRPGGLVRTEGDTPPQNHIFPIPTQSLPPEAFQMHEYLDELRKQRTGVGDEVAALDAKALGNINTGVAALAYDASRSKIELIARILSEVALKPAFQDIHELLQKYSTKQLVMRLRNKWVPVRPGTWRRREDVTVAVGLGRVSQERKMMALTEVMEKQMAAVEGGGMGVLVSPAHIHNALSDYTELLGLTAERYWMDPATAQPPEPGPDYNMLALQVQNKVAEAQQMKALAEARKVEADAEFRRIEAEAKQDEAAVKLQIEQSKARIDELEAQLDREGKERQAEVEIALKEEQSRLKEKEMELDNVQKTADREAKLYAEQLRGAVSLLSSSAEPESPDVSGALSKIQQVMGVMQASMVDMQKQSAAPRIIERDESGRVVSVGGRKVTRDADGRLLSI